MKHVPNNKERFKRVTPCVGVWIETYEEHYDRTSKGVTPCVGVWIETLCRIT